MGLHTTDVLFLKLLNSFVRQGELSREDKASVLETEDWEKLLKLSSYHQIVPMIFEAAMQLDGFGSQPPAMAGFWKREAVLTVARQARTSMAFLDLYQEMKEEGLCPLVVKGIVCRNMYGKPDYRMSGDEDLLLPREDFRKMDAFLIKRGFQKAENDAELEAQLNTLHEVGYRNPNTGVYLEVHLSLFPEESGAYGHFNQLFTGLHDESVCVNIDGYDIYTLKETEHFLYLLCHSAKHFLHSGFGIRQVFDMVLFAETYGKKIDWKFIIEKTQENAMFVFLLNLLDIGVRYLGFDWKKACLPESMVKMDDNRCLGFLDSEALLEDLLIGGVFGASSPDRLHSSNITLAAADQEKSVGGLRASLFPDRKYMEKKYAYVKKHGWLLPAAWGHRLLEYIGKTKKGGSLNAMETGNQRVALLKKYGMIE